MINLTTHKFNLSAFLFITFALDFMPRQLPIVTLIL